MSIQTMMIVALVGLLAGTHAAIWGMYKDAIHEGFTNATFARSMIVGVLCALAIQWYLKLPVQNPGTLVLLFGLTYAAERGVVEVWKTFIRDEDQSKYFIPMQFAVFGRLVHGRGKRLGIGLAVAGVVILAFLAIHFTSRGGAVPRSLVLVLLIGSIGGWISAFLGAWKDAPIEGFETLKFFRSPVAAGLYAFFPIAIFHERLAYTEPLVNFFGIAITAASLWVFEKPKPAWGRP